jgi:hypothetical protein
MTDFAELGGLHVFNVYISQMKQWNVPLSGPDINTQIYILHIQDLCVHNFQAPIWINFGQRISVRSVIPIVLCKKHI